MITEDKEIVEKDEKDEKEEKDVELDTELIKKLEEVSKRLDIVDEAIKKFDIEKSIDKPESTKDEPDPLDYLK